MQKKKLNILYLASDSRQKGLFDYLNSASNVNSSLISYNPSSHEAAEIIIFDENSSQDPFEDLKLIKRLNSDKPIILLSKKIPDLESGIPEQHKHYLQRFKRLGVDTLLPWTRGKEDENLAKLVNVISAPLLREEKEKEAALERSRTAEQEQSEQRQRDLAAKVDELFPLEKSECYVAFMGSYARRQMLFTHLGFSQAANNLDISFIEAKHGAPHVLVIDENELPKIDPLSKIKQMKATLPASTAIMLLSRKYTESEAEISPQDEIDLAAYMEAGVDKVMSWSLQKSGRNLPAISQAIAQQYLTSKRFKNLSQPEAEPAKFRIRDIEIVPDRHEVRIGPLIVNGLGRRTMSLLMHFATSQRTEHSTSSIKKVLSATRLGSDKKEDVCVSTSMKRMSKELGENGIAMPVRYKHQGTGAGVYELKS